MTYLDVRQYAADAIGQAFLSSNGRLAVPSAEHCGRMDAGEIKRLYTATPSIKTALLGVDCSDGHAVRMATFLVTKGSSRNRDDADSLTLLGRLLDAIRDLDARWAEDAPHGIRAENLYGMSLGEMSAHLWVVKWIWPLKPFEEVPLEDLPPFDGYEGEHAAGEFAASDTVDLKES